MGIKAQFKKYGFDNDWIKKHTMDETGTGTKLQSYRSDAISPVLTNSDNSNVQMTIATHPTMTNHSTEIVLPVVHDGITIRGLDKKISVSPDDETDNRDLEKKISATPTNTQENIVEDTADQQP